MQLIGILRLLGIRQTNANTPTLDMLIPLCLFSLWVVWTFSLSSNNYLQY